MSKKRTVTESREDLRQEARLIALEKGLDPEDTNYIAGVVRNLQRHNATYRGRLKEYLSPLGEIEIEDPTDVELTLDVQRAVAGLSKSDQRIAWYAFVQGWSGRMIASKIGRSPHHVQDRIFTLKTILRAELKELDDA